MYPGDSTIRQPKKEKHKILRNIKTWIGFQGKPSAETIDSPIQYEVFWVLVEIFPRTDPLNIKTSLTSQAHIPLQVCGKVRRPQVLALADLD